ncbi:MAG: SDR family oxidoreductase [Pseudomonadota bacterium]|nr:SDR family oxidoreductase [Pseudomonadota bacterium]
MTQTVLITGCSSGIGRETAKLFQQQGWNVVATMRSPEQEQELNQLQNVTCLKLDVCDGDSIQQAVDQALELFGAVDVLVNNAGYGLIGAFETLSREQIERQFQTNVFGLMELTRALLPHFRQRNSGTIINIASFAGRSTVPLYSVYHASKWAVEGFSDSLAFELSSFNIRVKIIEPGTIRTEFWGRSTDRENQTGVDVYADYSNKVLGFIDGTAAKISSQPQAVAKAILAAATDGRKKLRYVVGHDARFTLTVRKLLPDFLYNNAIAMVFHRRLG